MEDVNLGINMQKRNLFPTFFQIQTITGCNGRCIMCPSAYRKESIPYQMDNKLFETVINEISEGTKILGNKVIDVHLMLQNEPFLDKNLINKIKFVKQFDNIRVGTVTNGSLLNRQMITRLEESGLDSLVISVDSTDKRTFEEIRPGFVFEEIMDNIDSLRNSKLRDKVKIQMIAQRRNQSEVVHSFVDFWKNKGLKTEILLVTNRGGVLENFGDIDSDMTSSGEHKEFFKRYHARRLGGVGQNTQSFCNYVFSRFNILANGDVIKCCHDWEHADIMGNVCENTIKNIWYSKFRDYRLLFLNGEGDKIESCKNCSVIRQRNLLF